jgi:hypothetical protein
MRKLDVGLLRRTRPFLRSNSLFLCGIRLFLRSKSGIPRGKRHFLRWI